MRKNSIAVAALGFVLTGLFFGAVGSSAQNARPTYPAMAPLDQYLIADENAEIALARSAAPASISEAANVMVLHRDGYATAVKGSNGFVCLVERSWANTTGNAEFWNPKIRAPHCFNAPAVSTFLPFFLKKTELVLAGKSQAEVVAALHAASEKKEFPPLSPDTMVYMMSKQQYLNDRGTNWHPHVMFYVAGDAEKTEGANQDGSPVMAGYDSDQRVTTFFIVVPQWSDGTPGPSMEH